MDNSRGACALCAKNVTFSDAVIVCAECEEYGVCAECYVQGYVSNAHPPDHKLQIMRANSFTIDAPALPGILAIPAEFQLDKASGEEARKYWGDLLKPPYRKTASSMVVRLANALFIHADSEIEPRNKGSLNPAKYWYLRQIMGEAPVNHYSKQFGRFEANVVGRIWELWDWEYTLDETTSPPTPLMTRAGYVSNLMCNLLLDPEYAQLQLNAALTYLAKCYEEPLVDPITSQPFKYHFIPRECFPAHTDESVHKQYLEFSKTVEAEVVAKQLITTEEDWQRSHPTAPMATDVRASPVTVALPERPAATATPRDPPPLSVIQAKAPHSPSSGASLKPASATSAANDRTNSFSAHAKPVAQPTTQAQSARQPGQSKSIAEQHVDQMARMQMLQLEHEQRMQMANMFYQTASKSIDYMHVRPYRWYQ
ncbi:hypothetical protein BAUCODRAFT_21009 [Baudoinia panamericana UAMH 10762]|uniref:DUF7514 domain-containing protein n=1 Tax=Baudoinia panamericana (strain UAMH 10762) TaxID=717646 RepID=M2NNH3_BAUPA|nr:uncharacterized protein BAUCODRAFT_21009 [Baudoinia panamericana UAMH 10762]EMD01045.1 hypothetical protein BAUCODRAFT_21009 [Baudoinia panamericana UAMH 10762]